MPSGDPVPVKFQQVLRDFGVLAEHVTDHFTVLILAQEFHLTAREKANLLERCAGLTAKLIDLSRETANLIAAE